MNHKSCSCGINKQIVGHNESEEGNAETKSYENQQWKCQRYFENELLKTIDPSKGLVEPLSKISWVFYMSISSTAIQVL